MPRFDPLAGALNTTAPAKPTRRRRTLAAPKADKPVVEKPAPPPKPRAAATTDVCAIPLSTFGCMLGNPDTGHAAEVRAEFAKYFEANPQKDWRAAWRNFRDLPPPPARPGPATNVMPLPASRTEPEPPRSRTLRDALAYLATLR